MLKIIVAGNGGIGKTTMLRKFCYDDDYRLDERLTVGSEVFIKKMKGNDLLSH